MTFPSRLRRQNLKTGFAAHLREDMTDAERRLWAALRSRQVAGLKFRRQQPIGPYIVDFFCPSAKLVVELDGDQHGAKKAVDYDENRTRWLVERGYRVLRFPNADVFKEPVRIVEGIVHHCGRHDIPLPVKSPLRNDFPTLPQGEGG